MRLAVLLPVTSRGCQGAGDVRALFARLQRLRRHLDPPAHPAPPDQTQPPSPAAAATAAAQQPQPGDRAGSSSSSGSSWITAAHVCVCLGVDEDDPWLMASELPPAAAAAVAADAPAGPMPEVEGEVQDGSSPAGADGPNGAAARGSSFLVQAFPGLPVRLVVFTRAELELHQGPGGAPPLCWMWERLATEAVTAQAATHVVLLGDDTHVEPPGWPQLVLQRFAATGATHDSMAAAATAAVGAAAVAKATPTPAAAPPPHQPHQPHRHPLRCLVLVDAADPGYPSFPVLDAVAHLAAFGGRLFPPRLFVNQMGDPFLAELYRRLGGLDLEPAVAVTNATGGIQLPDAPLLLPLLRAGAAAAAVGAAAAAGAAAAGAAAAGAAVGDGAGAPGAGAYVPPRYRRVYAALPHVLKALEEWTAVGAAAWGVAPRTSVDVLVPCGRGVGSELRAIVEQCSRISPDAGVDVRFGVLVDTPLPLPRSGGGGGGGGGARAELDALRDQHMGRMRLRYNEANLGASRTRNRMMDESLAQLLVLLDDDVVPEPGLVEAYVRAAARNSQARGFVGPTRLPATGSAWAHAVHMSDVAFFWGAPASALVGRRPDGSVWLPWCVTANMAVRNTPHRFDPRFPRTGGGEDIDFCLRACGGSGGMLAVPEAACRHPLWNNGRPHVLRFAKWAVGDGQLIEMYPHLCYWAAPNPAELLVLLAAASATALVAAVALQLPAALLLPRLQQLRVLPAPVMGGAMGAVGSGGGGSAGLLPWWRLSGIAAAAAATAAAARQAAAAALVAALAVAASEALLELVRHCLNPARLARHPCPSWRLRLHAALIAALLRNVSEAGRLYGHACRAFGVQALRLPPPPTPPPPPTRQPAAAAAIPGNPWAGVADGGGSGVAPLHEKEEEQEEEEPLRSAAAVLAYPGGRVGRNGSSGLAAAGSHAAATAAKSSAGATAAAAAAATAAAAAPEGGVLGGGLARLWRLVGRRFDWFCGIDRAVVRLEQARAGARAAAHVSAAVMAVVVVVAGVAVRGAPEGGWLGCSEWRVLRAAGLVWLAAACVMLWRE